MENEQCGQCWGLKFDNQGKETHNQKYIHDFISIDYCVNCKKPKYDSFGIQTHPENIYDYLTSNKKDNHKFYSRINAEYIEMKRKQKNILVYFTILFSGVTAVLNIPNILF